MSDTPSSFNAPRGMRDFYPEDMRVRERVFGAWREAARRFGFSSYDACVVESLELLRRKAGEEIVEQIYAFEDKSGRPLALRPEMTPTLARMIVARQGALAFPLKWTAIAQCFRYERMTRGRKREHYQWNLDIVGGDRSPVAELEVLAAAAAALQSLGLGAADYRIRYNSRALLTALLAALGIATEQCPAVFVALDKRGKVEDGEIEALLAAAGLDAAAIGRVLELTRIGALDEAAARLAADCPALVEAREFQRLATAYGLDDLLVFDIGIIRGLSYYTGLVFEAFDTERKFRAIFGGGRYDNLLSDIGGEPATAVGLGFGDVVIAEILAEKGLDGPACGSAAVAVGYMDPGQRAAAAALATALRRAGCPADMALAPEKPKKFFARAGKGEFAEAAFIGPDDAAAGTVRIKNLATRAERNAPLPRMDGPAT